MHVIFRLVAEQAYSLLFSDPQVIHDTIPERFKFRQQARPLLAKICLVGLIRHALPSVMS